MNNCDPNIQIVFELIEINKIPIIPIKEITFKNKIGQGGQAKVYKGIYKDAEVAVKMINNVDWKCFAHEIVILSNLNHEAIPKFCGMVVEEGSLATVIKFIDGANLSTYDPNKMDSDTKLSIVRQLGNVLNFIHLNKFIHRDLKPENIMFSKTGELFLIDFGIAKICTNIDNIITRAKGTIYYLAPECLDATDYDEQKDIISLITTKVDVWGYGCILSYLYSGYLPWCEGEVEKSSLIIQKELCKKKPYPIPNNITDEKIYKMISLATKIEPVDRADMATLMSILDA
jgi:serine/threonine protein kinase